MNMSTLRSWALIGLMTATLPGVALAQAEARTPYRQTPAVLAQLADVPILMEAPGLATDRTEFTSQAEMEAHLRGLKARVPGLYLGSLGQTAEGRDLPWLVFTAEGLQDLAAVRRLNRPIVWLMGQQHGNEPSGGEAMLALASALADGELTPLLDRITVVVVPRMNPDGAAAFTRRTGLDFDLNRDHLLATLPESRAVQAAMTRLPPDVVVDAHEYGASSPLQRFGRLNAADQTILDATHPGVPTGVTRLARATYLPAMEARLRDAGLSASVYLRSAGHRRHVPGHFAQLLRPDRGRLLPAGIAQRRRSRGLSAPGRQPLSGRGGPAGGRGGGRTAPAARCGGVAAIHGGLARPAGGRL